jgi:catechol 2,3-dioxygenase-like lactoylglutathione lyase family enzyme
MNQRIDVITLGVPDLEAAHRFYVDGLGWTPTLVIPGEITFVQAGPGRLLALWRREALAADLGRDPGAAPGGLTLGHNVDRAEEVAEILAAAEAAGGTILVPARKALEFEGSQGYFADPAGYVWDIVHNPGVRFEADGRVVFASPDG